MEQVWGQRNYDNTLQFWNVQDCIYIIMVVLYCYLERENDKDFIFI